METLLIGEQRMPSVLLVAHFYSNEQLALTRLSSYATERPQKKSNAVFPLLNRDDNAEPTKSPSMFFQMRTKYGSLTLGISVCKGSSRLQYARITRPLSHWGRSNTSTTACYVITTRVTTGNKSIMNEFAKKKCGGGGGTTARHPSETTHTPFDDNL
jgi:hypothetical protein